MKRIGTILPLVTLLALLPLTCLLFEACGASPRTPQIANQLVYIGDSLTKGFGADTQAHAYAYLTGSLLKQSVNVQAQYGVTAVKTAAAMSQTSGPVIPMNARTVIIELGTNDVAATGETIDQFRAAYLTIVRLVRRDAPHARLICLGTWRDARRIAGDGSVENLTAAVFDEVIRQACRGSAGGAGSAGSAGGAFVPLNDLYDKPTFHGPAGRDTWLGVADAFHPNDAGHAAIAQRLVAALAA